MFKKYQPIWLSCLASYSYIFIMREELYYIDCILIYLKKYLHLTFNVTGLLTPSPSVLCATHVYIPKYSKSL